MKAIGAGLFWLASVTGASAYFPLDLENHARWVVLDDMPVLLDGQPIRPEVISLRTNDIATQPALISAVCGTLDFHNTDDGVADFIVLYSVDDDGKTAMVGRPFLYGRGSASNFDMRYKAAMQFCGREAENPVVADASAIADTAVVPDGRVAEQTDAAVIAKRD